MIEQTAIEVLRDLKKGEVHKLYLLFGADGDYLKFQISDGIKKTSLDKNTEVFDYSELDGNSSTASEVIRMLESPPFGKKRVIIIKNADKFKKSELSKVLKNTVPEFSVLVILSASKTKPASVSEKDAVFVKEYSLTLPVLRKWIKDKANASGKKIQKDAINELIERLDHNLYTISSEIKKLSLYVGERNTITKDDVQKVVEAMPQARIFTLVDEIIAHKKNAALKTFGEIISKENVAPEQLLSLLLKTLMQMAMIKELSAKGLNRSEIARKTGIYPAFVVGKLIKITDKTTLKDIIADFHKLETADIKSKRGEIDLPLSLRLFIEEL